MLADVELLAAHVDGVALVVDPRTGDELERVPDSWRAAAAQEERAVVAWRVGGGEA